LPPGLDIVVPVYNEEGTINELVARIRRSCPASAVIVVDNGSTDRTMARLESRRDVRVIRHDRNLGYGTSLRHGIEAGTGEHVVMIDADLEYLPEDIPAIDSALDSADAVYGSRFLASAGRRRPSVWSLGNRAVTALFNALFAQHLTDLYTGIRGVRRAALPPPGLRSFGFEVVLEIAVEVARRGLRIAEVPVGYSPRTSGQSKMRHPRELLKFTYHVMRFRLAIASASGADRTKPSPWSRSRK